MTRLYLLRHAHAEWHHDEARPLSREGHRDADRIADLLAPLQIAGVYSSSARRALETITPFAIRTGLRAVISDDLRERELPVQAEDDFESAVRASWSHPETAVAGGESNRAAQLRAVRMIQEVLLQHHERGIVVSTHGNLLALILSAFDHEFWTRLSVPDAYEATFDNTTLQGVRRIWRGAAKKNSRAPAAVAREGSHR